MSDKNLNQYLPDYLVKPGEVLEEYLEVQCMTQAELATRTGLAKKTINEIIKGKSPITPDTALKFERVLGRPAHFWNNLERQYQEDQVRIAEKERLESYVEWLKRVPVKKMIERAWIELKNDKITQLEEVLNFFGVVSPEQLKTVWDNYQVAFRQTQRFEINSESVYAWLRKGEIDAHKIKCTMFDKNKFQEVLNEIRSLSLEDPHVFQPRLIELCSSSGVAMVFTPELPKTGVCGATRWLNEKPIIQLSLRYKTNDHLWFTFFHEAGHIIKHGRKDIFLECNLNEGEKEEEANIFARDKLIPPAAFREFTKTRIRPSLRDIKNFANQIGIATGIVVGRLQHDRLLPLSHGNKLKKYYHWVDEK